MNFADFLATIPAKPKPVVKQGVVRRAPGRYESTVLEHYTAESMERFGAGTILEDAAGNRAIITRFDPNMNNGGGKGRIEAAGTHGTDRAVLQATSAEIAQRGPWCLVAYPPIRNASYIEFVYIDLDGTGRKIWIAKPTPREADRLHRDWWIWSKTKASRRILPIEPELYYIKHKGVQNAVRRVGSGHQRNHRGEPIGRSEITDWERV